MIQLAFLQQHNRGGLRFRRERTRQKPLSFDFAGLRTGARRSDGPGLLRKRTYLPMQKIATPR